MQERVDVAKQAKDTEAAVNLGISTKRLLSALDEAEKLYQNAAVAVADKISWERATFAKRKRIDPDR